MKPAILQKYQRYEAQVQALFADLAAYPEEQLNRQPANGGWSAIQTLHHLLLVEELSLAYVRKKLSFNPTMEKVGPGTYWRSLWLSAWLRSPLKRKAPDYVGDANLPAFATLDSTRDRWERVRHEWRQFLNELPDELLDKQVYKQPFAGRLGWLQTIGFFEGHFQRHRKQVQRALGG